MRSAVSDSGSERADEQGSRPLLRAARPCRARRARQLTRVKIDIRTQHRHEDVTRGHEFVDCAARSPWLGCSRTPVARLGAPFREVQDKKSVARSARWLPRVQRLSGAERLVELGSSSIARRERRAAHVQLRLPAIHDSFRSEMSKLHAMQLGSLTSVCCSVRMARACSADPLRSFGRRGGSRGCLDAQHGHAPRQQFAILLSYRFHSATLRRPRCIHWAAGTGF